MKAQYLKKLLDTGYNVADFGDYIGIGNGYVHKLIKLDKETMKISYALDTFHKGKECLKDKDSIGLLNIWNKLEELIESGEIKEILEGNDTFDKPIPVYYEENGEIIETYCYELGWPNTTITGKLMYKNTHFEDPLTAAKEALTDSEIIIVFIKESIEEKNKELLKKKVYLREQVLRCLKLEKYIKENK